MRASISSPVRRKVIDSAVDCVTVPPDNGTREVARAASCKDKEVILAELALITSEKLSCNKPKFKSSEKPVTSVKV